MNSILEKEFFNTPFVKFKDNLQGQAIEDDGTITIGNRAGPSKDISFLYHEMAHLVEINDERMRCYGWGLKLRQHEILGKRYDNPATNQATVRELRVFAYQTNLMDYLGEEYDLAKTVRSLVYMPDECYTPIEDGSKAWGDNKTHNLEYNEIGESQNRWRVKQVEQMRSEYTLDRFVSEWRRKMEWLGNNSYFFPIHEGYFNV